MITRKSIFGYCGSYPLTGQSAFFIITIKKPNVNTAGTFQQSASSRLNSFDSPTVLSLRTPRTSAFMLKFIHFSTIEELEQFVKEQPFDIIEHIHSYDIAEESEETKKFAGDTVFWAIRKK